MNEYLSKRITDAFPWWFRPENPYSLMKYGFTVDGGWFSILWDLCTQIKTILLNRGAPLDCYEVIQVKEKFGGLRWYYDLNLLDEELKATLWKEIVPLVREAERKSYKTCETCGSTDNTVKTQPRPQGAWTLTKCKECFDIWVASKR